MSAPAIPSDPARHLRHDLRTPMNAIMGYAEMLLEEPQPAPVSEALRNIMQTSRLILERIDTLSRQTTPESYAATLRELQEAKAELMRLAAAVKSGPLSPDSHSDLEEIMSAGEKLGALLCGAGFQPASAP